MTVPCLSVRPSVWRSLAHRRFCLPVSRRPLCPAPSAAFAPSSRGSPASNRQPWHTNIRGWGGDSERSERDEGEAGDWDTARGGKGDGEGHLFALVPPPWFNPRPHTLPLYYFLSERNVTKTSGRNFTETYGRNITSSLLLTIRMITGKPKLGPMRPRPGLLVVPGPLRCCCSSPWHTIRCNHYTSVKISFKSWFLNEHWH